MSDFTNELNHAQTERLALLLEELGEAQHRIGKILRHGYERYNPTTRSSVSNRDLLEQELGHVLFAIELLCLNDLTESHIDEARVNKARTVWKWMHHQDDMRRKYIDRWPATMHGVEP